MKTSIFAVGLATLFAASSVQAQVNLDTNDFSSWKVCVQASSAAGSCSGTDFVDAKIIPVVQRGNWPAGPWITANVAGAPNFGSVNGENPAWKFTYRTTFNLSGLGAGATPTNVSASLFLLDNYLSGSGFYLNGGALTNIDWSPQAPLAPNGGLSQV